MRLSCIFVPLNQSMEVEIYYLGIYGAYWEELLVCWGSVGKFKGASGVDNFRRTIKRALSQDSGNINQTSLRY